MIKLTAVVRTQITSPQLVGSNPKARHNQYCIFKFDCGMEIELKNINPKFVELFTQANAFTEAEFALFLSYFRPKTICKKDYYLRAGAICRSKAYLNKSCTRNFVLDEVGPF